MVNVILLISKQINVVKCGSTMPEKFHVTNGDSQFVYYLLFYAMCMSMICLNDIFQVSIMSVSCPDRLNFMYHVFI